MAIEHDYFGYLGSENDDELYWSETVEVGERDVDVSLSSPEQDDVAEESLDIAAGLIGQLESLDSDAREAFVGELSTDTSNTIAYFYQSVAELGDEILDDAMSRESGDRQIDFLRSMALVRVSILPHHTGDDEPFALFEYSIAPGESDAVLIARFNINADVIGTEMAS
ncbi:DUF2004 domain-containing protein [Microterricola pindariensis]|uniref:DUF2004 domain-containing protein n=1 Tax=Microterricola pindariensis TaxID=478010 RepID=A0ABX5ATP4_9MICO|nr:DUF2004 domain-containing protein [Microterricola pindariensis]PPL16522.1 hypothetical protein GY24_12665 [Microterricola pindariensis]